MINIPSWYLQDSSEISDSALVEYVLQYGKWNEVKDLITEKGRSKIRDILIKQISKKRVNYRPATLNFFKKYFNVS